MTSQDDLIARSNRLGADPRNTNYAGGNTSAKGAERDPVTAQPTSRPAPLHQAPQEACVPPARAAETRSK
jgi:hypothetical protein